MDYLELTSMPKMEKTDDLGDNSSWSHALGVSKLDSLAAAAVAAGMESSCGTNEKSNKIGDRDAQGDKDCSFKINLMSCSVSDKKVENLKLRSNNDSSDCDLVLKMEDTLEEAIDSDAPILSTVRGLKNNFCRNIREEDKADSLPTGSGSEMKDEPFEGIPTGNSLNEEAGSLKKEPISSMICTSLSSEKCLDNVGSSRSNPGKLTVIRTSIYHGVTRHRWSGKYEAHLWDNSCRMEGRRRKGKQVYLGSYDSEEKAARAYDVAALKYWGISAKLNFPVSEYDIELEDIKSLNRDECVTYLRRRSSCFSRGASVYRGVTRRQRDGRWQARIGRVSENKDIYLGTFKTEEEAAEAYDIAAIELRGLNTVTNFHISNYCEKGLTRFEEEDTK